MERRIGKNFVGFSREVELQKVLFNDADIFNLVFLKIAAEFFGGGAIGLNCPDFADAFRQGDCNDAGASANIEDEVTLLEVAMADKLERKAG